MSSDAIQVPVTKAKAVRVAWLWNWICFYISRNNNEQKNMCTFIRKFTKKVSFDVN